MLVRLYSETNLLVKDISFEPGINIILGRYSGDKEAKGINGIGKSSLVRLINFCFLSASAEKIFGQPKYDFLKKGDHNIILEFVYDDKKYFLKRSFAELDKVQFGSIPTKLETYEKAEMKKLLTNVLFPIENDEVFFEGNRFGTLLNFFLKDDLESQKRFDALNFLGYSGANVKDIAIYNFFLLNLPTKNLLQYAEVSKDYDDKSSAVREMEKTVKATTGKSIEEFKTEKIQVEQKISLLERSLSDYNFLEKYKNIEVELIELTKKINEQLEIYHIYNHDLKRLKDLYTYDIAIDTEQIKKLLNEALQTFGDLVKKSLDEVIGFKKDILANRNKFLVKKEQNLQKNIDAALKSLSTLEAQRSILYRKLKEKGALESIENTYKDLINEKTTLERTMQYIGNIEEIQNILIDLDVTISELKRDILNDLSKYEGALNLMRGLFKEILENAIFIDESSDNAYFDIKRLTNTKRNQLPFKFEVEIPKAEALGQARLKLIAYDLMVFFNSIRNGRKLPDFLVHDGVYHSISHKSMINTLNYISRQFNQTPTFQYIATFNEDEIEVSEENEGTYGKFDFNWKEDVILTLSDVKENMLFRQVF